MRGGSHHLEEDRSGHCHPVELNLKGRIQGEVAMVITAAPLQPICSVVHVHVQRHSPLLRNSGSYVSTQAGPRERGKRRSEMRRKNTHLDMKLQNHLI